MLERIKILWKGSGVRGKSSQKIFQKIYGAYTEIIRISWGTDDETAGGKKAERLSGSKFLRKLKK